jgi:hypothetical protein
MLLNYDCLLRSARPSQPNCPILFEIDVSLHLGQMLSVQLLTQVELVAFSFNLFVLFLKILNIASKSFYP